MKKLSNVQKKTLLKKGMQGVIEQIQEAFLSILDAAEYLGQLVILGREEWGEPFDEALRTKGILKVTIEACVKVAEEKIDPRLILVAESNDKYRYLAGLSLTEQKKALDKGVEVLTIEDDGSFSHILVKWEYLTQAQEQLCLTSAGIRTVKEQEQYVVARRKMFNLYPDTNPKRQPWETKKEFSDRIAKVAKMHEGASQKPAVEKVPGMQTPRTVPTAAPEPPKPDYEIKGGKLIVNKPGMEFDQVELIEILGKLAKHQVA